MPRYQYTCTACGHDLEVVQSFTDEPLVECPACGGRLRKVFTPVGVVFKGSGFYRTDARAAAAGSKESAKGGSSAGEGRAADSSPSTGTATPQAAGTPAGSGSTPSQAGTGGGSPAAA